MAYLSKVQIIGNVGADPEQRYTQQGNMMVSFRVAVNSNRRLPDGSYEKETEWFRVTAFGRLAEICQQYVTKGRVVYVDGRLRLDRWTGQDGQPRVTPDIVANEVVPMDSRPREDSFQPAGAASRPPADAEQAGDLEDLPF